MKTSCRSPADHRLCLTDDRDTQNTFDRKRKGKTHSNFTQQWKKHPQTFRSPELRFPVCFLILFDWPGYLMWTKKGSLELPPPTLPPPPRGSLWA